MRFVGTGYRGHDPKWAFAPTSGAGAARYGGRFNAIGTPALYLALTIDTMFAEMGWRLPGLFAPLTVCTYDVDCDDLVDLRTDAGRQAAGVDGADLACPWEADRLAGREPASWALARRLLAAGAAGLVVPSFAAGARADMANLVLWRWGPDPPHKVTVFDPAGRLPADQRSWGGGSAPP